MRLSLLGRKFQLWMRSSSIGLERLAANAKVATALGSLPTSSDTVEPAGRRVKQC